MLEDRMIEIEDMKVLKLSKRGKMMIGQDNVKDLGMRIEGGKIIEEELRKTTEDLRVPLDVIEAALIATVMMTVEQNQGKHHRVLQDEGDKIPLNEEDLFVVHLLEFKIDAKEVEMLQEEGVKTVQLNVEIDMRALLKEDEFLKKEDVMTVLQKDLHLQIEEKGGETRVAQKIEEVGGGMIAVLKKDRILQGLLINLPQEEIQEQEKKR